MPRDTIIVELKMQYCTIIRQQTFSINPTGDSVFKNGMRDQSLPCNVMPNQRHAQCKSVYAVRLFGLPEAVGCLHVD